MLTRISAILATLLVATVARADSPRDTSDWPQLRGPGGRGHATATDLPLRWSETENVRWKTRIPGSGYSSPVIAGARLWMTTSLEGGRSLCAVCVDAESGRILYRPELFRIEKPGRIHSKNSYATPTPVVDGERIYVHFGTEGTAALTRDGSVVWKNTSLAHDQPYAGASSPILSGNTLIVNCDGMDHQFVVALDKRTGKPVWKTPRAHLTKSSSRRWRDEGFSLQGYSTPAIFDIAGVPELVSPAAAHVAAYDARTGKELWWVGYVGFSPVAIPVFAEGLVFVQGFERIGTPALIAIRPGGRGDVLKTHVAWKETRAVPHMSTLLAVGDALYLVDDDGIMSCLDAKTGTAHWRERLGDPHSASPILADGRIYVCSERGKTSVLAPGHAFKLLAKNQLDGRLLASPCASGRALFLRTDTHLYRIEDRETE